MPEVEVKVNVGDKVTIQKDSCFYSQDNPRNPRGIVGIVSGVKKYDAIGEPLWFWVDWSNGHGNDYREQDLKVLGTVIEEEN